MGLSKYAACGGMATDHNKHAHRYHHVWRYPTQHSVMQQHVPGEHLHCFTARSDGLNDNCIIPTFAAFCNENQLVSSKEKRNLSKANKKQS